MTPEAWAKRVKDSNPGDIHPTIVKILSKVFAPLIHLFFRPQFINSDRLPKNEPYLLVANHSGGMALAEIFSFIVCYLDIFGAKRSLSALVHPFGFFFPPINFLIRNIGVVPSSYFHAYESLKKGVPLLVFPGGDYEACRPIWQHELVDFNGRKGFLKIARQANVPIVPMGIQGSHVTVPILWRSDFLLPKILILPVVFGIKRFPLTLLGLVGAILTLFLGWNVYGWWTLGLMWLWFISLLHLLPIVPSKISFHFGDPILPDELFGEEDEDLKSAYDKVLGKIQELVLNKVTKKQI